MTRARRRPGKTELYFEWIECIFWLIPMGIVVVGAAIGAVAFFLFGSLFASGCVRLVATGKHKRRKFDWEQANFSQVGRASEATSMLAEPSRAIATRTRHPERPACNAPLMLKRAGKGSFFRMCLSGCAPLWQHRCAHTLSVPRFPGATTPDLPRSDRF